MLAVTEWPKVASPRQEGGVDGAGRFWLRLHLARRATAWAGAADGLHRGPRRRTLGGYLSQPVGARVIVARQKQWKLLLPFLAFLMVFGGFWAPQTVSADDGINVSNMNQTHGIAAGVSQNGFKVCVVWSQFDVANPQAWVRVLDVLTSTWTPPIGQTAKQV